MRVGNVAVIVPQGREKESGYVHLTHGQVYTLSLNNHWNDRRCDAVVSIDGKDMGTFRLDALGRITLERPVHDQGCFTFYKADTPEFAAAAGGDVKRDDRGLVTVVFKPEKRRQHQFVARNSQLPREAFDGQGSRQYRMNAHDKSLGFAEEAVGGAEREEKTCGGIVLPQTARRGGPCGQSQSVSSGVTGLSGHSAQQFREVPELDYDPAEEVTVNLRLVAFDDGPRPLTSATKSNPVPAPVG